MATQAADEFAKSSMARSTAQGDSRTTLNSSGVKNLSSNESAPAIDVLDLMNRVPLQKKQSFGGLAPVIGKPVKPAQIPTAAPQAKPKAPQPKTQSEQDQLSMLVKGMSEESKRQEAAKFDSAAAETARKMQEITAMLQQSNQIQEDDGEGAEGDEFEDYMEQRLMADAQEMGVFEEAALAAKTDVYSEAVQKINEGLARQGEEQIDTGTTPAAAVYEDEMEQQAMEQLSSEAPSQEQAVASYQSEYDSVISEISEICCQIASKKEPASLNEQSVMELCPRV